MQAIVFGEFALQCQFSAVFCDTHALRQADTSKVRSSFEEWRTPSHEGYAEVHERHRHFCTFLTTRWKSHRSQTCFRDHRPMSVVRDELLSFRKSLALSLFAVHV